MSEYNLPWALNMAYKKLCDYGEVQDSGYMKQIRATYQSFYGFSSLRERCNQLTAANAKLLSTNRSLKQEIAELRLALSLKCLDDKIK